jgi:hypothetical protein
MALADDHDVVHAVATKRPDQTLAGGVGQRRPERREKASHPETTEPSPEARVVVAVAVAQHIAWRRVAHRLDHAMGDPRGPVACSVTPTRTIRRLSRQTTTNAWQLTPEGLKHRKGFHCEGHFEPLRHRIASSPQACTRWENDGA